MGTKLSVEQQKFYDRIRLRAVSATHGAPYLMPAIFKLAPVAVPNDGSLWAMAVDARGRVYINFEFVMSRDLDWGVGALIHEVWHVLRRHEKRAKHHNVADFEHWNTASDCEINISLPPQYIAAMPDICYPKSFKVPDDKTAEWYYDNIKRQDGEGQGEGQGEGKGEGQGQGQGQGEGKGEGQGQGQGKGKGQGQGEGANGKGECGSAAGGGKGAYEVDDNANGDFPEMSATDMEYTRKEVAKRIRKQIEKDRQQNGRGTMPGSLQEWAEAELSPPRVRWQDVFRGRIWSEAKYRTGRQVINRSRVRRRQANGDILYPAQRDTQLTAAAALDDSGSNIHNIPGALAEVYNMLRSAGVKELDFFTVDTQPGPIQKLRRATDPVLLSGGGGTDMRVAFHHLSELAPDIGILFTDSQTPWPAELPENGKTRFIIGALIGSESDEKAFNDIPEHLKEITIRIDLREPA